MRGEIKPSDLLYYYENLQHYIGTPIYKDGDITPEGVTMRHFNHPEYYDLDSKKIFADYPIVYPLLSECFRPINHLYTGLNR